MWDIWFELLDTIHNAFFLVGNDAYDGNAIEHFNFSEKTQREGSFLTGWAPSSDKMILPLDSTPFRNFYPCIAFLPFQKIRRCFSPCSSKLTRPNRPT